jgi:hypothetical protein
MEVALLENGVYGYNHSDTGSRLKINCLYSEVLRRIIQSFDGMRAYVMTLMTQFRNVASLYLGFTLAITGAIESFFNETNFTCSNSKCGILLPATP